MTMEKLDMWQECYCLWCNNDTGDASDNGALQAMTFEEDEDQHGRQLVQAMRMMAMMKVC